jgi:DNA repair protein RecO (recombination protein O)
MIVTTESIVLAARKHGDTSKIAWLYSREYGKVSVIAKGARELKSKFGGALEMFAHSSMTFYKKERTEGLYLLSKADLIDTNRGLLSSLESIESATEIVELVIKTMHDEEKNEEVFALLVNSLGAISRSPESAAALQIRFYIEFARISGFEVQPALTDAPREDGTFRFHLSTGELHQYAGLSDHMPATTALSHGAAMTLVHLTSASIEKASTLRMSESVRAELRMLFNTYFAHHFSGFASRSLRSANVFSSLSRGK